MVLNKIKNVLFVCMGNTARSPAAEYLGRYYAKKYDANLEFDSCGFFNAFSYMQPESQEFLKSKGIDPSSFNPKIISKSLLEKKDLILTMEQSHSIDIVNNFRNVNNIDKKTFTLKEFNGEKSDLDIIDPYYTTSTLYDKILKIIDKNVEKAVKKIIEINESNKK